MAHYTTLSADETILLGRRLGKLLRGGELVVFTGGLGAGKTTFCRGIAEGLGCRDLVSSPTFAIVNVYRGAIAFAHFDLYRVENADDLEIAGFYDYLDAGAVVAVEWSERLKDLGAVPDIRISITSHPDDKREISIEGAEGI